MVILKGKNILKKYDSLQHLTSFGGMKTLQNYYNLTDEAAKNVLQRSYTYQLHKQSKKVRNRNPIMVYCARDLVEADLIDMKNLKAENNNISFILILIDAASRYVWAVPLKKKEGQIVTKSVKNIISSMKKKPKKLWFDFGTEFKNKFMKKYLSKNKIKFLFSTSDNKVSHVERVNLTIQRLIYAYMTHKMTRKYLDKLQEIVDVYNNRPHRSLNGYSPKQMDDPKMKNILASILFNKYTKQMEKKDAVNRRRLKAYQIGDLVRINFKKGKFSRGYHEQHSKEVFRIVRIGSRKPFKMFYLQSINTDEHIEGGFYAEQLSKISPHFKDWRFTPTGRAREKNGILEYEVQWEGFDEWNNGWLNEQEFSKHI